MRRGNSRNNSCPKIHAAKPFDFPPPSPLQDDETVYLKSRSEVLEIEIGSIFCVEIDKHMCFRPCAVLKHWLQMRRQVMGTAGTPEGCTAK